MTQIKIRIKSVLSAALLSIDAVAIVATDGGVIAEAAGLQSLRWIDVEPAGAHSVEKLPDSLHDFAANALPIIVRENRILRPQPQVIQLARAIETFITPVLRATNYVVTTARDRMLGQDQPLERFKIDRKLQAAARNDVAATRAGREFVVVSDQRVVIGNVNTIDLSADLDRLLADKRLATQLERLFFRVRIFCRGLHAAKSDFEIRRPHVVTFSRLLHLELIQQYLVQKDLANLSIDLPDLPVEWRHDSLVLVKHVVGNVRQLLLQLLAV